MSSYLDCRAAIRSGDLLFFREHGFWPRLIRMATASDYCHVGVAWVVAGRVMLLEARQAAGVSVRLLSEALPADWIATGCEWSEEIETRALRKLQTRYSLLDAVRIGLGLPPSGNGEICSLFAGETLGPWLETKGVALPRDGLTPGHLAELFLGAGCVLRTLD